MFRDKKKLEDGYSKQYTLNILKVLLNESKLYFSTLKLKLNKCRRRGMQISKRSNAYIYTHTEVKLSFSDSLDHLKISSNYWNFPFN